LASDLLVATRSHDKLDEIRAIVNTASRSRMLTLRDLDIPPSAEADPHRAEREAMEAYPTQQIDRVLHRGGAATAAAR
jgi:hypothetical protein